MPQTLRVRSPPGFDATAPFHVSPEKIAVPNAPVGALERPRLADHIDAARRRLTALVAPGGFGKSTLLAACCRQAEARGDKVVWLSVDESDDAQRVVAHLTFAADVDWDVEQSGSGAPQDVAYRYLDALLAAVGADRRRWVMAFDELERIPASGGGIVDYLIARGPANLHLLLACRGLPPTVDIATTVAEGRGLVAGSAELRFTRSEFGAYFDGALSREQLREAWAETQGWPIAACMQRNLTEAGQAELAELSLNWVAARLMRGVGESDRRFVLEASSFEWLDVQMLDEVLGVGAAERLRRLTALRGLVTGLDGAATIRVHPLVRRHAERELKSHGGAAGIRRRIARSLAARGRTIEAMRQALEANDGGLAARIFEDAGAVRLAVTVGVERLKEALTLLPEDIAGSRLDLARLVASSTVEPAAASAVYESLPAGDAESDVDLRSDVGELQADSIFVAGILVLCGCRPTGSPEARLVLERSHGFINRAGLDPIVAGGIWYGQCVYHYQAGDFDIALAISRRAGALGHICPSAALGSRIVEAAVLFAQGSVGEAESVLAQAQRAAHRRFAGREGPAVVANVFAAEAALETHRLAAAGRRVASLPRLGGLGAWLDVYAASIEVQIEVALHSDSPPRALDVLDDAWTFAQVRHLESLVRWLAASRVTALVRLGRVEEARMRWREAGLAAVAAADADGTERLSWRETEAIRIAEVRLLLAQRQHEAALAVGRSFVAQTQDGGAARSQSRATALAMRAAWLVGDKAAAEEYLAENLRLYRRTGFARALLEQPDALDSLLGGFVPADVHLAAAAESVLKLVEALGEADDVALSTRETEVLVRLDSSDKEIGRALGLTQNGVRYHVKKIIRKLGVANRYEAMNEARRQGLLDPGQPGTRELSA